MSDAARPATTNPAQRLHTILTTFVALGAQGTSATLATLWGRTLEFDPADRSRLLQQILEIRSLVEVVRDTVQKLPGLPHETLLEHYGGVENFVGALNLELPYSSVASMLAPLVLRDVKHMSDWLARSAPELAIPKNDLDALSEDIDKHSDVISASGFDENFKRRILTLLEEVRHAIKDYQISGAEAFRGPLTEILGEVFLYAETHQEEWESAKDSEVVTGINRIATKLWRWLANAHLVFALVGDGHTAITKGMPAIERAVAGITATAVTPGKPVDGLGG